MAIHRYRVFARGVVRVTRIMLLFTCHVGRQSDRRYYLDLI